MRAFLCFIGRACWKSVLCVYIDANHEAHALILHDTFYDVIVHYVYDSYCDKTLHHSISKIYYNSSFTKVLSKYFLQIPWVKISETGDLSTIFQIYLSFPVDIRVHFYTLQYFSNNFLNFFFILEVSRCWKCGKNASF